MISANEARALSKQYDVIKDELKLIEEQVCKIANEGGYSFWWFPKRVQRHNYGTLKARLVEFGYSAEIEYGIQDKIYVSWRG